MLSLVCKVYGSFVIYNFKRISELLGEEHSGFMKERGCFDQIFVMRQVLEEAL